jgi:hypothetical protein
MMTSPAAKRRRRFPVSQGQDAAEQTRHNATRITGASVHGQGHAPHRQPDPAAVPDDRTSASRLDPDVHSEGADA